ncbi:Testis-expressed sequence 2 protein, partial [Stegodyphus mimosarum]
MWIDFDFNYDGNFQMTLKTRLKMTRGKHLENTGITDPSAVKQNGDSIDSSDEDESEAKSHSVNRNKLFNKIEKWISYRHFQTVAQSKFVKRYVGDISNMPLTLTVEVNALHGILTVNIPPVPSDRVWYGFRKDPVLSLTAYPKVGTREINLSAVVQMIERKLIQEFKKALVMP